MSKLNEDLYGCLMSILRRGGVSIQFEQMEAIRLDCDKLAESLEKMAEAKTLEKVKQLQEATYNAFKAMESDIQTIEYKITSIKTIV